MFEGRSEGAMKLERERKKKDGLDEEEVDDLRVVLQEIGPRWTVKLRWVKKGGLFGKKLAEENEEVEGKGKGKEEEMNEDTEIVEEEIDQNKPDGDENSVQDENVNEEPKYDVVREPKTPLVNVKKRKRKSSSSGLKIPYVSGGLAAFNKIKTEKERKELKRKKDKLDNPDWEWNSRMQISRRKFFM
jgi:ribosome production factor 1